MLSNHHWSDGTLSKIDTQTGDVVAAYKATDGGCVKMYGIAIDPLGDIWTGNLGCNDVLKFSGQTGGQLGRYAACENTRGVAIDMDGNAWAACSAGEQSAVAKLSGADGRLLTSISLQTRGGVDPIGIGVDAYGYLWVVNHTSENVLKFVETSPAVFSHIEIPDVKEPYTYSDMLGTVLHTITLHKDNTAYWSIVYDTGIAHPTWKTVSWVAELPGGSSIGARMRCAASSEALGAASWWPAAPDYLEQSGQQVQCASEQYIELEVRFTATETGSPILKDITIGWEK
jgi:hypothetical protein